jgi:hypothetical protein
MEKSFLYSFRHKPKVLEIYPCSHYQEMMEAEKTRYVGLGDCPDLTWLVQFSLLSLIIKKTPSAKTALYKTSGINSGNAYYDAVNSILFHFS